MESDGFTLVTGRKAARHPHLTSKTPPKQPEQTKSRTKRRGNRARMMAPPPITAQSLITDIKACMDTLTIEHRNFVDKCISNVKDIASSRTYQKNDVLCYGIGQFSVSQRSKIQMALILLIRDAVCPDNEIVVYEPTLNDVELRALSEFHCNSMESDNALHKLDKPSILYMPHCPKRLYSNAIRANWSPEGLANLILLGNSFTGYEERSLSVGSIPYIHDIHKYTSEFELYTDRKGELYDAFSDLSLHSFSSHIDLFEREVVDNLNDDEVFNPPN